MDADAAEEPRLIIRHPSSATPPRNHQSSTPVVSHPSLLEQHYARHASFDMPPSENGLWSCHRRGGSFAPIEPPVVWNLMDPLKASSKSPLTPNIDALKAIRSVLPKLGFKLKGWE